MDYEKLVKAAGYKGDVADYIARKLKSRQVPKAKLISLSAYFPRSPHLAGVNLTELGAVLHAAAVAMDKPATKPKAKPKDEPTAKDTAVNKDGK